MKNVSKFDRLFISLSLVVLVPLLFLGAVSDARVFLGVALLFFFAFIVVKVLAIKFDLWKTFLSLGRQGVLVSILVGIILVPFLLAGFAELSCWMDRCSLDDVYILHIFFMSIVLIVALLAARLFIRRAFVVWLKFSALYYLMFLTVSTMSVSGFTGLVVSIILGYSYLGISAVLIAYTYWKLWKSKKEEGFIGGSNAENIDIDS